MRQLAFLVVLALLVPLVPAAPARAVWVDPALASAGDGILTLGLGFDGIPDEATRERVRAQAPALFYDHLPVAVVFAKASQVADITGTPGLLSVVIDTPAQPLAEGVLPVARQSNFGGTGDEITRADQARALGFDGKGVGLAVIDLGATSLHPGLRPRAQGGPMVQNVKVLVSPDRIVSNQPADSPVTLFVENMTDSDMTDGHGTHTAGIAAGTWTDDGSLGGRAPGADLIAIGTGDALALPWILGGWEWVLAHREAYNIRIVSNSYGITGPFNPLHPIALSTKAANDAGILVLFSAGNSGPGVRTLNTFAQAPWVLAVGSTSLSGAVVPSSSRGDPTSGKVGPDLVAPGAEIISGRNQPLSGNEVTFRTPWTDAAYVPVEHLQWYRAISGTSMACPQVAGIAALVFQANPSLTPDQARTILTQTARPVIGYERYAEGAGMVDAKAAVLAALGQAVPPRDVVQPTIVDQVGDAFHYPFHGAIVGGPDKSTPVFHPHHFVPVFLPSTGARIDVSWSSPTPLVNGLVLSLTGPDGALVAQQAFTQGAGTWSVDLPSDLLAAHANPRWTAAYWDVTVDLDDGAVVYDIDASASYAGGVIPEAIHQEPLPPPPPPPLTPHAPIVIASDADFTAANGVVRGAGTLVDPFVIEGWDFSAPTTVGITIGGPLGTSAYFTIQNVRVHDSRSNCANFAHVAHATIRDSQFDGCDFTLFFQGGSDVQILHNTIRSSRHGATLYGITGALLSGNLIEDMAIDGIVIGQGATQQAAASTGAVIVGNELHGSKTTIILSSPAAIESVVKDNTFGDGAFLDLQILPTRAIVSGSTWLDGTPHIAWRVLTVPHPEAGTVTIVDAGSDHPLAGHVCFTDARANVQPPDVVAQIAWDFGDGSTGEGAQPCHDYAAGSFVARIVVTLQDATGATSTLEDTARVG